MIGYGKNKRTKKEVARLCYETFSNVPPISVSRACWSCNTDKKAAANIMLEFQENPHTSSTKTSL